MRLGYHWVDRINAFMRMSYDGNNVLVELVPLGHKMSKGPELHICFWEGEEDIIDYIPCLKYVCKVKRSIQFMLNDQGERI